jgi:hypothetical protein
MSEEVDIHKYSWKSNMDSEEEAHRNLDIAVQQIDCRNL